MAGKDEKNDKSLSRSRSRSVSYDRRRISESPSYDRRRSSGGKYERNRRSISPGKRKYKKKTSRDNSAENIGNYIFIINSFNYKEYQQSSNCKPIFNFSIQFSI